MTSVAAFLRAVSEATVLRPDVALDALTEGACEDVRALLEETTGALARFTKTEPAPLRVHFTRSLYDARARWLAAWKSLGSTLWVRDGGFTFAGVSHADPLVDAAWETFFRTHAVPLDERTTIDWELRVACSDVRTNAGAGPSFGLGVEELLGLEVAWQLTSASRDEASPWAPLWALWQRGAWPSWLGGSSWIVYVPLRNAAGAIVEPEAPDSSLVHATEQAVRVHAASALVELGLAPAGRARQVRRGYFVEHRMGSAIPLGTVCMVGRIRDPSVHISVPKGNVSKRQCTVLWSEESQDHLLQDAKSTAGTWLNGARVSSSRPLDQGDRVSFGDNSFTSWFAPPLAPEVRALGLSAPGALSLVPRDGTPARRVLQRATRANASGAAPSSVPSFLERVLERSRPNAFSSGLGTLADRLAGEPWGGDARTGPEPRPELFARWAGALRDQWPVPSREASPGPAVPLPIERAPTLRAFFDRFHSAWDEAAQRPFSPALAWPFFAMRRASVATQSSESRVPEGSFCADVDAASTVWSGPLRLRLRALGSRYEASPSPGAVLALEVARKSASYQWLTPWSALLEAWFDGYWPVLLPGPAVLVYKLADARNEPQSPPALPLRGAPSSPVVFDYRTVMPGFLALDDPRPTLSLPLAPLVLSDPANVPALSLVRYQIVTGFAGSSFERTDGAPVLLGPCTRIEDPTRAPTIRALAPESYPSKHPEALWIVRTNDAWWLDGPALERVPVSVDRAFVTSRTPLFPGDRIVVGETGFGLAPPRA